MKTRHSHVRPARRALTLGVAVLTAAALGARSPIAVSAQTATLWGIDACSSAQSVVPSTQSTMGNPQFMARYLGTSNACGSPGLTPSEVTYLSSQDIYIMLIADPSSVDFSSGTADAQTAIQQAQSLGAPPGTAIFRDVENSSPISVSYIENWYAAFESSSSGYVPGFYENPYSGSGSFPGDYCSAVSVMAAISTGVALWSDEPEPNYGNASPTEAAAPAWNPSTPPCSNTTVAWQYLEDGGFSAGSWPSVDVDEFDAADESLLWNAPKGPGAYTPLAPFRVCDTRASNTTACSGHPLTQGGTLGVQITGVDGPSGQSVPSSAQSVVLNVTAISDTAATALTVYPTGYALPDTSNLNVDADVNQANLVVVALGGGGRVSIYNSLGSLNIAVDVEGYFAAPAGSSDVPGLFHPIAPLRICDTRQGTGTACSGTHSDDLLGPGQWTRVVVSGCPTGDPTCSSSVPANSTAAAVALNLTAVSGTSPTYMAVEPAGAGGTCPSGTPAFSNLNVNGGTNLPNRVIVPLGPQQDVCVYNSLGSIDFILDVNGWFGNGSESTQGAYFYAVSPLRICDTRGAASVGYSTECSGNTLGPRGTLTVPVAGVDGLPPMSGSSPPVAVIANVTAVSGSAFTYFTVYPANASLPTASDLNATPGQNVANLDIVQLAGSGANAGAVDVYNNQGSINAVVDVEAWFQ
jgi:hypothetical protein